MLFVYPGSMTFNETDYRYMPIIIPVLYWQLIHGTNISQISLPQLQYTGAVVHLSKTDYALLACIIHSERMCIRYRNVTVRITLIVC